LLEPYMKRLVEVSHQHPMVSTHMYWNGEFRDQYDWHSLIEFWYQIRCLIVHGSQYKPKHAWLAYETLNIFMGEIIDRMRVCFDDHDLKAMQSLSNTQNESIRQSARFKRLQYRLYRKYIASPNIWQVDMQRVGGRK